MLLGAGHFQASLGPLMLLSANVICLNLAGVVTFASKGIRPRTWWESRKARGHVWIAAVVWTVLLMSLVAILWLQDNIHF
jgi:hypothetical protein